MLDAEVVSNFYSTAVLKFSVTCVLLQYFPLYVTTCPREISDVFLHYNVYEIMYLKLYRNIIFFDKVHKVFKISSTFTSTVVFVLNQDFVAPEIFDSYFLFITRNVFLEYFSLSLFPSLRTRLTDSHSMTHVK